VACGSVPGSTTTNSFASQSCFSNERQVALPVTMTSARRGGRGALLRRSAPRCGVEAARGGKRQVNERDDAKTRRLASDQVRHGAERQAVNDGDGPSGDGSKRAGGVVERCGRRVGKTRIELQDVDCPSELTEAFPQFADRRGSRPCAGQDARAPRERLAASLR
jgi:hypothetical protein